MAAVLSLSLIGCGREETSGPADNTPPVSEEQQADGQAKADDYNQITDFATMIVEHYALIQEISSLTDQVRAGEVDESVLLEQHKKNADHSQTILEAVEDALWKTDYYQEPVELLNEAVKALAEGERLLYEAGAENDEAKLTQAAELLDEYNVKADQFLTLMGF